MLFDSLETTVYTKIANWRFLFCKTAVPSEFHLDGTTRGYEQRSIPVRYSSDSKAKLSGESGLPQIPFSCYTFGVFLIEMEEILHTTTTESTGTEALLLHEEVPETHASGPHISLKAETLFHIGSFPVTNSLLSTFFVIVLLVVAGGFFKKRLALIPRGFQNLFEAILEGALGLMDSVLGERAKSEKYLPLIATIFLFVLISNWSGLIPGVGSIGIYGEHGFTPLFRAPSADLNFTLAVALTTIVAVNLLAVIALGFRMHAGKFFNFKNPIFFSVGILELISEFAKIISFSFRLFGNVFAGEVLLTITAFLVPYVVPLPFLFLEVFVGFIQALVFAMLALVFLATSTVSHEAEAH